MIPQSTPYYGNTSASFITDFEDMFRDQEVAENSANAHKDLDEGWANVNLPSRTRDHVATLEPLPSLESLGRPETLFPSQLPYTLIVSGMGDALMVQASHQPSLELLASYLDRYTRTVDTNHRKVRLSAAFF